jgi:hypothetical protein
MTEMFKACVECLIVFGVRSHGRICDEENEDPPLSISETSQGDQRPEDR